MCMMNSFTNEELDEEDLLKMKNLDSRIKRVAKGSGRSINEVNDLLQQFKKFQIMVKNMGDMKLDNIKSQKDVLQMQRKLPNILKGMGGGNNQQVQQLMKQFGNGNMKELMESMGGIEGMGDMNINDLKKEYGWNEKREKELN